MWLIYAIFSAVFAGITAILAKIGTKQVDSNLVTALRTVIILIFSWFMVFVVGSFESLATVHYKTYLFLVLSGVVTGGSWLCYFKALQLGDVNKVTPIDKSSTVLTMLLAFVILGESISLWKLIGLSGIAVGTYLMINKKQGIQKEVQGKGWLFYAVLSAVFASLTSILGKIGISGVESNLGTAIRTVVVLIMAWVIVFVTRKQGEIKYIDKKSWIFIFLSGITTGLSWLCYYKALKEGEASIVVPIDKLSIVVTVIFSYIFLKERLTCKEFIGFMLLIVGTLIMLL